jgi:hypothetical protein
MRRYILVTAIAVILTIGSGSLQASSCASCRRGHAAVSAWQQIVLLLPTAFALI